MTSCHDGVSCDCCRKNNFKGLRYRCLNCYDYDLCSACYEGGLTSSSHSVNHAMQCIVARNDYDLFYGGESLPADQPQSLTCPICSTLGFTETTLLEHITNDHMNSDHEDSSNSVVCPICGAETNQLTYDFATHLSMEHRAPRDQIEQVTIRGRGGRCQIRNGGPRPRRSQQHYSAAAGPTGSPPTSREHTTDPLVEMLTQLSGVRRTVAAASQSPASQLHQIQMHLQSSPSFSPRSTNEVRVMRRNFQPLSGQINSSLNPSSNTITGAVASQSGPYTTSQSHYCNSQPYVLMDQSSLSSGLVTSVAGPSGTGLVSGSQHATLTNQITNEKQNASSPQYLLSKCLQPVLSESEQQQREILNADRSLFVQEILLQLGLLEKEQMKGKEHVDLSE